MQLFPYDEHRTRDMTVTATAYDQHRGGAGTPLVLLHGLTGTWRAWRPVLPALEAEHEVLAPTLPGHHRGPPFTHGDPVTLARLADGTERILDAAGIDAAHLVGNSLGGWVAIELGRRGRARSITALSPAGGWTDARDVRRVVRLLSSGQRTLAHAERLGFYSLVRRPRFRRLAFRTVMEHGERVPPADAIEMMRDAVGCDVFAAFLAWVRDAEPLAAAVSEQSYPIRVAWAEHDRTIPFQRYGRPLLEAMAGAEHITLPHVGHMPMYDDPALVARTILEITRRADRVTPRQPTPNRSPAMPEPSQSTIDGARGKVVVSRWDVSEPTRIVVIAHGIGEHAGRYGHVAERLNRDGAVVYAPDHHGHGRSDGEPGLVDDVEAIAADVGRVIELARSEHPGLPTVLIGHSLGGVIVTRYVQAHDHPLDALVLSGPVIGGNPAFQALLEMDPMPDVPIDPATLSRDPAVGEAYANDPLVYHGPLTRETLGGVFAAIEKIAAGPSFGSLPVLWVHGEADQLVPIESTRPVIEQLRGDVLEQQSYPGAAHEIFNETNKDEVIGDLVDWATRKLPAGAPAN